MSARATIAAPDAATPLRFEEREPINAARSVPIFEAVRDSRSVVGEEIRLLRARIQKLCHDRSLRCLAVVSALPGEGKSTTTLGLAAALAREPGRRVLLIEADLRKPSIAQTLGLAPASGLAEWLNGTAAELPVRRMQSEGFFTLQAGLAELERPESLGSAQMEAMLRAARSQYEYVLLDSAPVVPVADAVLLQELVDGFVFVVRSRLTPKEAIREALNKIRQDKVVGIVLNDHRAYRHSYTAYSYDKYGMTYGKRRGR
jgi:capsular exopolysaccharide synthesis family protein